MFNNQEKGLKRNILDKFYTKSSIAEKCINLIKNEIKIKKTDLIIEPSAGDGVFIEYIKKISNTHLFYDIKPEHKDIITCNFLEQEFNFSNKNIHIIGNPPFGRQSSIAIKFIKKCCNFSNSICFILPKSFKKESMKKHFKLNFHLIKEVDLDNDSFLLNNKEYDVPCIFQIWIKKEYDRAIPIKLKPKKYKFVKKNENPDISFRRVGINAGNISKDIENKSIQSHYFIKFDNFLEPIYKQLSKIKYSQNNTVGPKSISKPELIKEFNLIIN